MSMKTVSVKFIESEFRNQPSQHKLYDYLVPERYFNEIEKGGHVVVVGGDDRLCVCRIEQIHHYESSKATKRIVCVIDETDYRNHKDREARKVEVMAALTAMEKRRKELQRFEEAAIGDPEMQKLVTELKTLNGLTPAVST